MSPAANSDGIRTSSEEVVLPYRPAKLRSIADPVALKDATVRDYKRWSETMGIAAPSTAQLEQQAIRDLLIVDAYRSGVDAVRSRARAPRARRAEAKLDHWSATGGDGGRLVAPQGQRYRPRILYQAAHRVSERWAYACARIFRLLEGASIHKDIRMVASTAAHPKLALRFLELWANYLMRGPLQLRKAKHNPFDGLSDKDASRKFERMVYDICDASHGFNGPWWVPK
jgi:hypothetical protein